MQPVRHGIRAAQAAAAAALLAAAVSVQAQEPASAESASTQPLAPDAPPSQDFAAGDRGSHSVARVWNEALLDAIRNDYARPTVHARNLFHAAIAMYDAWAAFDDTAAPYLLGRTVGGFACPFSEVDPPADVREAREEAISYAVYRIIRERFRVSPGARETLARINALLAAQGHDRSFTSADHAAGSAAALGNHIAGCLLEFGLRDGANEWDSYANRFYRPVNPPLNLLQPGNPTLVDPNRWQPLTLEVYIDQAGNEFPGATPPFISPEWGEVVPFALSDGDLTIHERDGYRYRVYHDPGAPPYLDPGGRYRQSAAYQWGFVLVSIWSAHLDPADGVLWDISPASIGNVPQLPRTIEAYPAFYDMFEGGDPGKGHEVNPRTGEPYAPQWVPRADYARVLAEFWADGPDSETPPGHWFTILNYVNDHPDLERRFRGQGPELDGLEWDVKTYFALGGAVHDAAIAAWGLKGWYDYIRPISAIRGMAERGQSSDPALPRYDPEGIPLVEGYVELVREGDALAGAQGEHVGKVKLYAWRGPAFIERPESDVAGVGWILAENWWPYQRPSFVTPPFAGYVSGHSTYSRAGAEVLTLVTGDAFFPGGIGEFPAGKDEFLVFEDGPSVDLTLQWATYRDAADQCSLSRIWGGIHPPADDIPGRLIGEQVGIAAFHLAERYFTGQIHTWQTDG